MRSCSLPKPLHPASSRRPVPTYLQLQRVYQNHHLPYRENLITICPGGRAIGRVLGFFSPRLSELTRTSSSSLLPLTTPIFWSLFSTTPWLSLLLVSRVTFSRIVRFLVFSFLVSFLDKSFLPLPPGWNQVPPPRTNTIESTSSSPRPTVLSLAPLDDRPSAKLFA